MLKYKPVQVSEKQLEDLVRQAPDLIEEGLRFIDHQRRTTRGPLDVLLADSANALVVAELKIVEDDHIPMQGHHSSPDHWSPGWTSLSPVALSLDCFPEFYGARRTRMAERLKTLLGGVEAAEPSD